MADARSGGRTFASAGRPSTRGFLSEWYKTKHAFTASPGFQGAACNAVDNPSASPSTGNGSFLAGLPTMTTPVDVLIIGAGASGAAVAWSLAETKMHILCLEQGDWMKPSEYPSARPRLGGASAQRFPLQPEPPRARHRLSDQRGQLADQGRQLQRRRRRHRAVCGSLPALPSVGLPRAHAGWRRRRLADRLRDAGAVLRRERPHDGRVRPGRRSGLSAA